MTDKRPSRHPKKPSGSTSRQSISERKPLNDHSSQKNDGDKRPSSRGVRKPKHVRERAAQKNTQKDHSTKNLRARSSALEGVLGVVEKGVPLDVGLDGRSQYKALDVRDRAFARAIASAAIRRYGAVNAAVKTLLERPLPDKAIRARMILHCGATELLVLGSAPHAVVDAWVSLMDQDSSTQRYKNLANAVLRRVLEQAKPTFDEADPILDLTDWWAKRWVDQYGQDVTRSIMSACSLPPPLDITTKPDIDGRALADKLDAEILPTGTIRRASIGAVEDLPDYKSGLWWVQDVGAALPVKCLNPKPDEYIIDLCAAPGGKTLQIAASGASVTAVDASPKRLKRLSDNLARTGLKAEIIAADACDWQAPQGADGVLLDAPCTATGTLRRRPDASFIKQAGDIDSLGDIQARLLDAACAMLKPGGRLVYCTCSMEVEEGEAQIEAVLSRCTDMRLDPVKATELPELDMAIDTRGMVRTRPDFWPEYGGIDGFFIARLIKV